MKSNNSQVAANRKSVRQNGMITLACAMTVVLVTVLVIASIPNLPALISVNLQHVIIAILVAQVASLTLSGRRDNQ